MVWLCALWGLFQSKWFYESINDFIFLTLEHLLKDSNLANLHQEKKLSRTCSLSLKLASWHSLVCTYSKVIFLSQNQLPFKGKCPYCLQGTCPVGISAKLYSDMIRESATGQCKKRAVILANSITQWGISLQFLGPYPTLLAQVYPAPVSSEAVTLRWQSIWLLSCMC